MPKSEGSITIDAPIERVFNAVADPRVVARISSGTLVRTEGEDGEVGSYSDWEYLKLHSRVTTAEANRPYLLVQEIAGAMPGKWTWTLEQTEPTVKTTFCVDYSLPGGIFGRMANRLFLGRVNQKNVQKTLHGLKKYCEE